MNWKIMYKDPETEEVTTKIFPSNLPDLTEQHHTIWDSVTDDYMFLPSLLGWEKQPDSTTLHWVKLSMIGITTEVPEPGTPTLEQVADLFASLKDRFRGLAKSLNTQIDFLYADASNYKVGTTVVVEGAVTEEQKAAILDCRDDGEYFIPSMVGLPGTRFDRETEDDHPWFTLQEDAFSLTIAEPTEELHIDELAERFQKAKLNNWGQMAAD